MRTKYTPGPWQVGYYAADELAVVTKDNTVALLDQGYYQDEIANSVCVANAKLIAAAPDMFEALEHIMAYFAAKMPTSCGIEDDRECSPYKDAFNAIRKAKGLL